MRHLPLLLTLLLTLAACDESTSATSTCGDGVIDVGEQCDGGNLGGNACTSLGYYSGNLVCSDQCTFDITQCQAGGSCGDGVIQSEFGEQCDGVELGGATCHSVDARYYGGQLTCSDDCTFNLVSCETEGYCGDGIVQTTEGEECDGPELGDTTCESLGYYAGTLSCASNCAFDLESCQERGRCGDNIAQTNYGEACDGIDLGVSTCQSLGFYGGQMQCDGQCAYVTAGCEAAGRCGDGVVQINYNETCDGSAFNGQTCISMENLAYGELLCEGACTTVNTADCHGKRYANVQLSGGASCAVDMDRVGWCWGTNNKGQLGTGLPVNSSIPTAIAGSHAFTSFGHALGFEHICGLTIQGNIYCQGAGGSGQLGTGGTYDAYEPVLVVVSGITFTEVTSGYYHSCGLGSLGGVYCWGQNSDGQLGFQDTADKLSPVPAWGVTEAIAVSGGGYHTCVLVQGGAAQCWGENSNGQLGNGTTTSATSRVDVSGGHSFSSISAGGAYTCALDQAGAAWCWGWNNYGQLGTGNYTASTTPVAVSGGHTFASITTGYSSTCGIDTTGQLWCWGYNGGSLLGTGDSINRTTPTLITPGTQWRAVSLALGHTCALEDAGGIWCWGYNGGGQLGDGTTTATSSPVLTLDP